jgi:mannose-6-phosphate isomerase-like protein (cupin superfamily)
MQVIDKIKLKPFITKDRSEIREFYRSQNMSLAEAIVEVGQTTEYHFHKISEEVYYMLEGKGLMEVDDDKEEVSEDQAVVIPPRSRHRISNTGSSPLIFLCLCSPPYSDEDTVLVEK